MARRARPTLRCLRENLAEPIPPVNRPLGEVSHPLLAKVSERFADDRTPQERIAAVDDQVLLKVKVQRWRGAVWIASDNAFAWLDQAIAWLVAAGHREDGSPEDFYAALADRGRAAPSQYNATHRAVLSTETHSRP